MFISGLDDADIEKLMIEGAKYNPATGIYVDMIIQDVSDTAGLSDDLYDFTESCPPASDSESPLNF